jgi:putative aldouronate transport system substrate-binding protein
MKRLLAFVPLFMVLGGFVFATGQTDTEGAATGPVKVTVFQGPGNYPVDPETGIESAEALPAYKIIEERTHVDIEWYHPSDHYTELALRFASDDLTDVIITDPAFGGYPGGVQKAYNDGYVLALNEYLAAGYAPNYQNLINTVADFRKGAITDEGMFLAFTRYEPGFIKRPYLGYMVRQDWLDRVAADVPEKLDDWYNLFKAWQAANLNGTGGPVVGGSQFLNDIALFAGAFGVVEEENFMLDPVTGNVEFAKIQPEYKELLQFYLKLIDEGLMDPETFIMDDGTFRALVIGGEYGMLGTYEDWFPRLNDAGQQNNPEFLLVAAPYPMAEDGNRYAQRNFNRVTPGGWTAIKDGVSDEVLRAAMRWVDFAFTQEGADLLNWGVLGESYEIDSSGKKRVIVPLEDLSKWSLGGAGSSRLMDVEASFSRYTPFNIEQTKVWANNPDYSLFLPGRLTYTADETDQITGKLTDINTYAKETILQILQGAKSIAVWDDYVATLKRMGVDEITEITQNAYDRYVKR